MGAFILVFIIRMAGATMEQKERAEASTRLSEDRFRSLIQHSSDATLVIDRDGICTYVSPAITSLLGRDVDELIGIRPTSLVHPDEQERVRDRLGSALIDSPANVLIQFRMSRKDGTWCDLEAVVTNQLDRPSVAGYVANVRDITERKEFEALLAHRAVHDPLTGLANRQLILDRTEQMLARSRRSGQPVAAYFIDLDNFKDANDSLGHEAGDRLLQAVADRFVSMMRAERHRGPAGRGRVRGAGRGDLPRSGPRADRRADPRCPPPSLPGARLRGHPHHGDRQHRHRHRLARVGPRPAARRRRGALPGQGQGSGRLGPVRVGHAVGRRRPAGPQVGPRLPPSTATSSSSSTSRSSTSGTAESAAPRPSSAGTTRPGVSSRPWTSSRCSRSPA